MRSVYLVTYDVCDPKRLRLVFRAMRGFGQHLQYSVFRCELSARELVDMSTALEFLIKHDEDQVLIVDLGPAEGRATSCIRSLGQPYTCPQRHAVVV